jgi:hypothetical protein
MVYSELFFPSSAALCLALIESMANLAFFNKFLSFVLSLNRSVIFLSFFAISAATFYKSKGAPEFEVRSSFPMTYEMLSRLSN